MRRLVALALVLATLGGTARATAPPELRLVALSPLTVAGTGFVARERVTVTVKLPGRHVARVTASASGAFRVSLRVLLPRCGGFTVSARGERGDSATLRVRPRDCMQP